MNRLKRTPMYAFLALAVMLPLAGCVPQNPNSNAAAEPTAQPTTEPTSAPSVPNDPTTPVDPGVTAYPNPNFPDFIDGSDQIGKLDAAWMLDETFIVYGTWGSSSCHPIVDKITTSADDMIILEFAEPSANQACTLDYGLQLNTIGVPVEIDTDNEVTLVFTGYGFNGERVVIHG